MTLAARIFVARARAAGRPRAGAGLATQVPARAECLGRGSPRCGGGHAAAGGAGWLAERLQHAAIVAGNFTWNTTGGFNDATRAKASR